MGALDGLHTKKDPPVFQTPIPPMRTIISAILAVPVLAAVSCTPTTTEFTTGDRAPLRLQDLTRYGQPHFVNSSLREQVRANSQQANLERQLLASHPSSPAPVDFVPPALPSGTISFDGSLLPPKVPGITALVEVTGPLPE